MIKTDVEKPNPGSPEAVLLGCACPVIDNHNGAGFPVFDNDGRMTAFWIMAACPLHGVKKSEE